MGSQQSVPEGEDGDVRSRSASPLVQEDNHWGKYENNESYDAIPGVPYGQQFDEQPQSPVAPPSGERKKKKKKKSKHRRSPSPAVEPDVNGDSHHQDPTFADPEPAATEEHELPEAGKKKKKKKKRSKPEPQVEEEEQQAEPDHELPVDSPAAHESPNLKFERPEVAEPEPQSAAQGSAKFKKRSRKSKKVTVDISDDPISDGEDNVQRTTKIHRGEAPSSEHHVKRRRLSPEPVAEEEDEYDHVEVDASFVKREPGADEHEPSMVGGHEHTSPLVARERRRASSASQHPVEVASSAPLVPQFATQQSLSFHDDSFRIPASIHPMDLDDHINGLPNTQDFADGLPPSSQAQFDGFPHSSQRPRTDGLPAMNDLPAMNNSMWEDNMRHDAIDEDEPEDDYSNEGYMHDADEVEADKADVETASSAGDPEPDNHSDHEMDVDQAVADNEEPSPEVDAAAEVEDGEDSAPEVSVTQTPAPKARKSRTKKAQAQPDAEPEQVEQAEEATPAPTSTAKTPRSKGSKRKVKVPYFEREEAEGCDQAETSAEPSVKEVAATQKDQKREKKRKSRAEDEQSTSNVEPAPKKAKVSTKKKPAKKADSDEDNSEIEEASNGSKMAQGRMTQAEHARIKAVIDSFRDANGLTKHAVNEMIHQDPRKDPKNRELWGLIVDACPNRPRRKVVNYCRQNFHNFPARGSWTKEQDEELESMLKLHGQKWTLIGGLINRFPDDVRDRYRNYLAAGGKNRKDYWSEEEEERFLKVVAEAIDKIKTSMAKDKKKSEDESPESLINWQQISTAMNHTRTRLQCLQKWKTLRKNEALPDSIMVKLPDGESSRLDKARKDLRKITPEDKALLVRAIRDSGADRENKIKWKEIQKDVFDKQYAKTALTVTWGRLRQAVPQWESKSTQECAKYLCDMYERDADWKGDEEVGDDAEDDADARSTVSRPASVVVSSTQQTKIYRTPRVGLWDPPKETKTNLSNVFAESSDNEMRGRTSQRARERAKRLKESEKASSKSRKSQLSEAIVQDEDSDEEEVEESINGDIAAVNGNDNQDFEMDDAPEVDAEEDDEESEPAPSAPVVQSRAVSVDLGEPSFISSPQLPTSAQKPQDYSDDDDEDIIATTSKAAALKASKKAAVRTYGKASKSTKSKRKEKDLDLDVPLVLGAAVPSLPPPSTSLTASHPQLSPKRPAASQARRPSFNENNESDHSDAPANSQHNKKRRILTRQPSVRTTETIIKTTASVVKASKRRKPNTFGDDSAAAAADSSEVAIASAVPDHLLLDLVEMDGNLADDSLVSLDRPGDVVGGVGREKKVASKAKQVRKNLAASGSVSVASTPAPLVKSKAPSVVSQVQDTYSVISSDMDDMEDIPAVLPALNGTQG
ncbi:hypothetical protein B0H65DRAFT_463204 [Neurospora tetraspora]|uniref:Uncharacterized protein n=1 Tax=Neurospora tetraspora TaxID=94610 RepID=A0AAE0MUM5_9PEZI|nr:hypothetical protein B0H65DRAFT_463204 [Neurospora tetraspora]